MRLWGVCLAILAASFAFWAAIQRGADSAIQPLAPGAFSAAYLIPDAKSGLVEIYVTLPLGEMDNPYAPGLAHYVEHLAWLNTVGAATDLTNRHSNAMTTSFSTSYWLAVPAEGAGKAMATLARLFMPLTLDPDYMLSERAIVQREYDLRLGSNPVAARYEALMQVLFAGDGRARSVLGKPEDIADFSLTDAVALHAATHVPGNAVVIIYGNITAANAQALVDTVAASAPVAPLPPRGLAPAPIEEIRSTAPAPDLTQQQILLAKRVELPQPVPRPQLQVQLEMLHLILTSSLPGSLAKPLRYDAPLAQGFDLYLTDLTEQAFELDFIARPVAGVEPDALLSAFDATLAEIAAKGVPPDTFERLHRRWLDGLAQAADPARSTLGLALAAASARLPLQSHADFVEMAGQVTPDQIAQLLRAMVAPGRRTIDILTPE